MSGKAKIPASDEAWDNGELGREEAHVKRVDENVEAQIDKSLDLQMISIRLQKGLIEDFKSIASLYGIGYQPLMRQILKRFVDAEKRKVLRDMASEMKAKADTEKKRIQGKASMSQAKKKRAA